jgi:phenylpropionate dioxygenase-like ring-hydroxylating dioxygenase large terminal subunit
MSVGSEGIKRAGAAAIQDLRRVGLHPDHWYPLAWSKEVKAGKPLGVRFADMPIVLVRPKDGGAIFALEDRCAHRQVPLRNGVIDGDGLKCGYHGWRYDRTGKCTDVPYLGCVEKPNGVRAFPCVEKDGVVLVWPGDKAKAADTPLPDLGSSADKAYQTRYFGREIACHYSFMHENLMDMNHQFLHRRNMGMIRPRYLGRRIGDDWLEIDYSFARTAGKQSWGEAGIFAKRRKGGQDDDREVMTIRLQYPYQKLWIAAPGEPKVMDLWIAYVPTDAEQRRNRTFGLLSVQKPPVPGLIELFWPAIVWFTNRIFAEDRWIVELEQAAHDAQGADWNNEIFPPLLDLRGLLAANGVPLDAARPIGPGAEQAPPAIRAAE